MIKVACVQMNSGPVVKDNLVQAEQLIREAASHGAEFILTPENTDQICFPMSKKLEVVKTFEEHMAVPFFAALAKELGVILLIGSIAVKRECGKVSNQSLLYNASGELVARYNKIHLFDAVLSEGESYRESSITEPGTCAIVREMGKFKLGLSICYDLRFAQLYRDMAKQGANIITVPAAYTVPTGRMHWEVLLRARAIETGAFILAPGQTGTHEGGRTTWGHTMMVNPWGEVISVMGQEVGYSIATLELDLVRQARETLPSLKHDRVYELDCAG